MVVQRKWMYLEGIFIGGDIRSQLPEEARKFDQIDKTFKKVKALCTYAPHQIVLLTPMLLKVLKCVDWGEQWASLFGLKQQPLITSLVYHVDCTVSRS